MTSALDARCPYCHAGPGHFCRDRSGNTRHAHETRKAAAGLKPRTVDAERAKKLRSTRA